jgi:hypothetical protein
VARGLVEIDSEAKALSGHAVRCGSATLDAEIIGQAIRSIHAVLEVIDNAAVSIRSVVELVQKLKSTFSDCTSQILGIALRLRMVALNAQIFAAHVDTGAALEVVASNTRSVADEAMQQLDDISSRVAELIGSVVDLEQRLNDHRELAVMEQVLLTNESAESEQKLRALEQSLRGALGVISSRERDLSETIKGTAAAIRFPDTVSKASSRATALFEQITLEYADSSGGADAVGHHKVEELNRNYTMAHERALHEEVTRNPGAADGVSVEPAGEPYECFGGKDDILAPGSEEPDPDPVSNGETGEERLADNVELF